MIIRTLGENYLTLLNKIIKCKKNSKRVVPLSSDIYFQVKIFIFARENFFCKNVNKLLALKFFLAFEWFFYSMPTAATKAVLSAYF